MADARKFELNIIGMFEMGVDNYSKANNKNGSHKAPVHHITRRSELHVFNDSVAKL